MPAFAGMTTTGFSLVELSIVLVILGLLTGGILTGQTLIRAAELRAVTTEFQRYQAAVNTFRDKYFAIPGDMRNATDFWGIAAGTTGNDATCRAASGIGTATCNGNGTGIIEQNSNEAFRFWQHLIHAGLAEGRYAGITNGANDWSYVLGDNAPRSKLSDAGWAAMSLSISSPLSGNGALFDGTELALNNFWFGAQVTNNLPVGKALTLEEAWNIDTKADDGLPATGGIMAYHADGWNNGAGTLARCTLATSGADKTAGYALTVSDDQCALIFRNAF